MVRGFERSPYWPGLDLIKKAAAGHNVGGHRFDSCRQKEERVFSVLPGSPIPHRHGHPGITHHRGEENSNTQGYEEANTGEIIKATWGTTITALVLASSARDKRCRQVLGLLGVSPRHRPWRGAQRWSDTEISVKDGCYGIDTETLGVTTLKQDEVMGSPKTWFYQHASSPTLEMILGFLCGVPEVNVGYGREELDLAQVTRWMDTRGVTPGYRLDVFPAWTLEENLSRDAWRS